MMDPHRSENRYAQATTVMPRPPGSQPTIARASPTSACDMPQRSINSPAKMKDGIASNTQLCVPLTTLDAMIWSGRSATRRPATAASPSAKTIGSESRTSTTKTTNIVPRIMSRYVPVPRAPAAAVLR